MQFGEEKQAEIFKKLAYGSAYQVGLEYGFDKVYSSPKSVRNAVSAVKTKVKNNPAKYEKFGITTEVLDLVAEASAKRNVAGPNAQSRSLAEQRLDSQDIKALMGGIRDKTFNIIDRKLDMVGKSRKKIDSISFKELGVIGGIAFDKSQILKGEATENIAVMAKIDKNISADDALALVGKMREVNSEANDVRNK